MPFPAVTCRPKTKSQGDADAKPAEAAAPTTAGTRESRTPFRRRGSSSKRRLSAPPRPPSSTAAAAAASTAEPTVAPKKDKEKEAVGSAPPASVPAASLATPPEESADAADRDVPAALGVFSTEGADAATAAAAAVAGDEKAPEEEKGEEEEEPQAVVGPTMSVGFSDFCGRRLLSWCHALVSFSLEGKGSALSVWLQCRLNSYRGVCV